MAKEYYKIPADLDTNYGDMEIVISAKSDMQLRPMPVKMILGYVFSALALFFVLMKTFMGHAPLLVIIGFVITWVALTMLLFGIDKTKRMKMSLIPSFFQYIQKGSRKVITRTTSNATSFYQIAGINAVRENGMIEWSDNSVGFMYRVTGSASVLLFEGDRNAILDRVDAFYRKIDPKVEIGFITTKEAQKVHRQIANLSRMYNKMECDDPELKECAEEQFRILSEYVGKSFRSIHQYMFLKADNEELLMAAKNVLQSEIENSAYMIKQCVALYRDDICEVFREIYQQQMDALEMEEDE